MFTYSSSFTVSSIILGYLTDHLIESSVEQTHRKYMGIIKLKGAEHKVLATSTAVNFLKNFSRCSIDALISLKYLMMNSQHH